MLVKYDVSLPVYVNVAHFLFRFMGGFCLGECVILGFLIFYWEGIIVDGVLNSV
jgi:hypothetical protein